MSEGIQHKGFYGIADALDLTLNVDANGRVMQSDHRDFTLGPWAVRKFVQLESDYATETNSGLFVKMIGHLWFYVTSEFDGPLSLYVINAKKLEPVLTVAAIGEFAGGEAKITLDALKKGIVASYKYDKETQEWKVDAGSKKAGGVVKS